MNIDTHDGFLSVEENVSSFERWVKLPKPNFDPTCDCITKAIVKEILSLEEHVYESVGATEVLPCSFYVNSSFKCDILSHNFFDLVLFASYNIFSKLRFGHEIEIEMARLFTDSVAEFIDHSFSERVVFVNMGYVTPNNIVLENSSWTIDPERERELELLTEKAIFKVSCLIDSLNGRCK
jgi:hypothetical protein